LHTRIGRHNRLLIATLKRCAKTEHYMSTVANGSSVKHTRARRTRVR
jgi:hypothetical protein